MNTSTPIAALVNAVRAGNGGAMGALYRRFAPVVHGVLLAQVSAADADDLAQDVFETVILRLPELRDAAAFPGWIVSIARRAALDAHRRRRETTGLNDDARVASGTAETRLDAERSLRAVLSLPEAYRETLLLRLVEGLTGPEIAACTGLAEGSVRVNLHRGMALLRAALGEPQANKTKEKSA